MLVQSAGRSPATSAVVAAVILVAGCSSESRDPERTATVDDASVQALRGEFDVTEIHCLAPAGEYTTQGGNYRAKRNHWGPEQCDFALELFFEESPRERIAAVIPIQHPPSPRDAGIAHGTQRLVILHTRKPGPWPLAGNLVVFVSECLKPGDRLPTFEEEQAEPMRSGRWCGKKLEEEHIPLNTPTELWVPIVNLTSSDSVEPGTRWILKIMRDPRNADDGR